MRDLTKRRQLFQLSYHHHYLLLCQFLRNEKCKWNPFLLYLFRSTTDLPRGDPINAISGTLTTSTTVVKVDMEMQQATYTTDTTCAPGKSEDKPDDCPKQVYTMFLASGMEVGSGLDVGSKCTIVPRKENDRDDSDDGKSGKTLYPLLRGPADLDNLPQTDGDTKTHRPIKRSVSWAEPEDDQETKPPPYLEPIYSKQPKGALPPVDSDLPTVSVRPKTSKQRNAQIQGAHDSVDPPITAEKDEERERRREKRRERRKEKHKDGNEEGTEKRKKKSKKDKEKRKDKKKKDKKDKRKGEKERKRRSEETKEEHA